MFRAIALSLAILVGLGAIIPLATDTTEAGSHQTKKKKKRGWRGVRKYSKRWWQLYRAQERRKKSLTAKKRALRLSQIRMAAARETEAEPMSPAVAKSQPSVKSAKGSAPAVLPTGDEAPTGWKNAQSTPAELQFRVDNSSGDQVGSATISVVGPAVSAASGPKSVGGVSTSTLRRDVIDRMVRENGWVVNDYQKDIAGQPVYVVVAQSQTKSGSVQSRMFYFTEVDGRIYSVATNSPNQESERLAEESEKVINSLKTRIRPSLRASIKE